jgi:hypothetical protein
MQSVMNAITFQIKLESDTIHLDNVKGLIGKHVKVTIEEVTLLEEKPKQKLWQYIGSVKIDKNIDQSNIRDLAYD